MGIIGKIERHLKLRAGVKDGGHDVTAEQFGDEWPFTVDAGTVAVVDDLAIVFRSGGKTYALNGFPEAWFDNLSDLKEIWKPDPEVPALRMGLGPITRFATSAAQE